ncbi:MAG: flagellar assembly protein FliW [Nitrospira sp.]|nr:flagellar assembly protein FliW [Nitrospira sp.]MBH0183604.1 flagellar assembly protein FliW [Nitrospira sp.]MBH0186901.1 flagellar assembly protein FliW [Nitrospira sp.]
MTIQCRSSRFGMLDIDDDSVLTFPSGLLGFPESRRYVMLDHDTEAPFKWLQSLDDPAVAFVIIDPDLLLTDYHIGVSGDVLVEVQGSEEDELTTAVILTIPSEDPGRMTANLRGPLLMNQRTKLCKQLVLPDEFPTRHPLFPTTASDSMQCLAQSHP